MDEIDAALDFRNVSIIAQYIKSQTRNAQFGIISLRNNMFELADRLIGIYKTHNCTHSIAINPGRFAIKGSASTGGPLVLSHMAGKAAEVPKPPAADEDEPLPTLMVKEP
jgi:hypothetical protein